MELPKIRKVEVLDRPGWEQSKKDIPLAVAAMGLGYGIGATAVEMYAKHLARTGQHAPSAIFAPATGAVLGGLGFMAERKLTKILKDRRDAARRAAGVAPQHSLALDDSRRSSGSNNPDHT